MPSSSDRTLVQAIGIYYLKCANPLAQTYFLIPLLLLGPGHCGGGDHSLWTEPSIQAEGIEGSAPKASAALSGLLSQVGGVGKTERPEQASRYHEGYTAVSWARGCSKEQGELNECPRMIEPAKG